MCEIFAMSSAGRRRVEERLREFYSHSDRHPNGWGLVVSSGGISNWEKEPINAAESFYLKHRLDNPIAGDTVLAHIRYATVGNVEWANCHPFVKVDVGGRQWILIHNGTVFEFSPSDPYVGIQQGQTDSERILLYIVDRIDELIRKENRLPGVKERFSVIEDAINSMSQGNKLNLLIFDGEMLYGHTNLKGSLFRCEEEGVTYISTRPLIQGHWEEAPFLRLFAYKNGKRVMEGSKTSAEYTENEQDISQLYLAYSGL